MSKTLKMSEDDLIKAVKKYVELGIIRRFGATVRHHDLGYKANAMVVWDVPDSQADEAGRTMAAFAEVTHCYRRSRHPRWPFNLYTMVHGRTREECLKVVERIAAAVGLNKYRILFSTAELKKSSMRYFE